MASDGDLTVAAIIALIVIALAVCVWPGFARARARDLAGYWADAGGALYEIRPGPAGGREFTARGGRAGRGGPARRGRVTGLRGVELDARGATPRRGQLDLGGRRISWKNGGSWARQGVR